MSTKIVRKSAPSWEPGGKHSREPTPSPAPSDPSIPQPCRRLIIRLWRSASTSPDLARYLGLSVRSLDRAAAAGLTPAPDLVCGGSIPLAGVQRPSKSG